MIVSQATYNKAAQHALARGHTSARDLQRTFKIRYTQANRIIAMMLHRHLPVTIHGPLPLPYGGPK